MSQGKGGEAERHPGSPRVEEAHEVYANAITWVPKWAVDEFIAEIATLRAALRVQAGGAAADDGVLRSLEAQAEHWDDDAAEWDLVAGRKEGMERASAEEMACEARGRAADLRTARAALRGAAVETPEPVAWMVEEFDDGEWDPLHLAFDDEGAVEFCADVRERVEAADETITLRIRPLIYGPDALTHESESRPASTAPAAEEGKQ